MDGWQGKKVLVTGAGGFIGSHLAERLVDEGADVTAFVHYNALGTWGWLDQSSHRDQLRVVAGDITDRDSVAGAMEGVQVVFHLAALIAIPYSYDAPASYVRTNIDGTVNVLQSARLANVERVIQTSTSETYGTARYAPIDEAHPLQGQSPYSATKIGADKLAESFHLSFDLPVVTVRPFNTFGPRQSARAVIPTIITQCLAGTNIRLGNIHPTRDLNFVSNTVDGFLLAAMSPRAVGRTINIGYGKEISIGDLAQTIARLMEVEITIETEGQRMRPKGSEVDRLLADTTLARDLLGYAPQVDLEDGLTRTIDWVTLHQKRYRAGVYVV